MTICALLLGREFYRLGPSHRFMYATLGLLFVNVSVGGALTNFAAPPVLIVAAKWGWRQLFMFTAIRRSRPRRDHRQQHRLLPGFQEGIRAADRQAPSISRRTTRNAANRCRSGSRRCISPFSAGPSSSRTSRRSSSAAFSSSSPSPWRRRPTRMRSTCSSPLLVGFFLAGLVVHGGLQAWWIEPVLSRLGRISAAHRRDRPDRLQRQRGHHLPCHARAGFQRLAQDRGRLRRDLRRRPHRHRQCAQSRRASRSCKNIFPDGSIEPGGLFLAALGPTLVMLFFFALPR